MINIPMQLTEEKKHYPVGVSDTHTPEKERMYCEMCVYGSGVHSCDDVVVNDHRTFTYTERKTARVCECGHSIECHSDVGCMAYIGQARTYRTLIVGRDFCPCLKTYDRCGYSLNAAVRESNNG